MIDIVVCNNNEKELVSMAEYLDFKGLVMINGKPVESKIPVHKLDIVKIKGDARPAIEKGVSLIYNVEDRGMKEFMHYRNSGLNQVLCKIAAEKGVSVGFNMGLIIQGNAYKRSIIMGRMMQNARFCRKFGVKQVVASFAQDPFEMRGPYELMSLAKIIGIEHSDVL
ncbi:MAG: RNase P subunit p30 family protein [Candidatus Woesearchaeota archaeon]